MHIPTFVFIFILFLKNILLLLLYPKHVIKLLGYNLGCYNNGESFLYLLLYVDNMLIAIKSKEEIRTIKAQLNNEFEMKDLGAAMKILGMEILRDRVARRLSLSQKGYIEKVLRRFNMQNAKPATTPLATHFRLSSALYPQLDEEIDYMSRVAYSSAVGSLMYAMVCRF